MRPEIGRELETSLNWLPRWSRGGALDTVTVHEKGPSERTVFHGFTIKRISYPGDC